MGDIVEISTQESQPAYYRVSAGAIKFEIMARIGTIGLTKSPEKLCQYFIIFGMGNRIKIKGPHGGRLSDRGTCTLSTTQYKKYWIAWDSDLLRVGLDGDSSHIVSYPNVTDLNYVVFIAWNPHTANWRFESPPAPLVKIAKTIPYKPVTGGELRWVQADDQLPDDAVVGGFEGECLYIIRGPHRGSLTPGKFVPSEGVAYVPWGSAATEVPEFEILVGYNYIWESTSENRIPINAFVAGHSETHREKLYIGRAKHKNCLVPGKVQPSHKVCYIAFEDKELPFKEYEILTVPDCNLYAESVCKSCSRNVSLDRAMRNYNNVYDEDDGYNQEGDEESEEYSEEEVNHAF